MQACALTRQGRGRPDNQDRYLIKELGSAGLLVAVADGLGGEAKGGLAAQVAVDTLAERIDRPDLGEAELLQAFTAACRRIQDQSHTAAAGEGAGTTLTAVLIGESRAVWAHVGDSRLYLWREGRLQQVTRDHSAAAFMVEEGLLSPEEARWHPARHLLFECLGCEDCEPDSGHLALRPGDLLLLCSDGLHGRLPATVLHTVLADSRGLEDKVAALSAAALAAGGRDDLTVVLIRV